MDSRDSDRVATLADYVEDAARQRLHLLGWEMDRQLVDSGWSVIYSIDTNIINLFLDPIRVAAAGPGGQRQGYTQIFRSDPRELTIALGRAISEFVLFRLGERSPIVMLPPLEREVGNVFQGIAVSADREHRDALNELGRIRENMEEFLDRVSLQSSDEARLDAVIATMPQLHTLLFGHDGPSAELNRFSIFLERSSLTDLDQFLSTDDAIRSGVAEPLRGRNSVFDWIEFSHLQGAWESRVGPLKSEMASRKNIEADSKALARLEQLNKWLNPVRFRVVHVTGDRAIQEAAKQYRPNGEGPSFAELYVRNPRSFLAEPTVLFADEEGESGKAEEIVPWLDVFLAKFTDEEGVTAANLLAFLEQSPKERGDVVRHALARDPDAGDSFADQWGRFTGPITLDLAGSTLGEAASPRRQFQTILSDWVQRSDVDERARLQDEARTVREQMEKFEHVLRDLEALVVERVLETWRDCFAAATSTGFSLVRFSTEGELPPRSPVPIAFANFQKAGQFFSAMLGEGQERHYRQMIQGLESEDETGYLFYLAFGALFGAQGKWRVAQILADRALEIVEAHVPTVRPAPITGREAYYLRAAACRLTARRVHDLDNAQRDLDRARTALAEFREGVPDHPITDVRFDAEQVALELSRILFEVFVGEESGRVAEPEALVGLQDRIQVLLRRVERELDGRHRERVRTALLVNSLTCLFLELDTESDPSARLQERNAFREVYEDLRRRMLQPGIVRIEHSYLHRAVFLAARELFEPPKTRAERRERLGELADCFSEEAIEAHLVAAYDRRRFEFLGDFAMATLGFGLRRRGGNGATRPQFGEE